MKFKGSFAIGGAILGAALGAVAFTIPAERLMPWRDAAGPIPSAPTLIINASHAGVGRMIADVEFVDLDGRPGRLTDFANAAALVVAVRDVDCPNSKKLGPRLASIESEFAARNVAFLFVNLTPGATADAMRQELESFGFRGRYVHDPEMRFGRALDVESTTEVFVLDGARTLRYRGAIDDQYGVGMTKPEVEVDYLRRAIVATLDGKRPRIEATTAPGCLIEVAPSEAPDDVNAEGALTYHRDIARLIQRHCVACHREEGMAPFSLESLQAVKAKGRMIEYVLEERLMPPWPMADGYGPWLNDHSLPDRDREAILQWIAAGYKPGDPSESPFTIDWPRDWSIGTPDAILEFPEAVHIPAQGFVDYKFVYLKTNFPEDRWVQEVEIKPTVRDVVHHLAVWAGDSDAGPEDPDSFKGKHGGKYDRKGFMAIIVPGQGPTHFPEGTAKFLPKGAWLKFQMHYTPNGTEVWDRPKLGLKFADEPPEHEILTNVCISRDFLIPAHASNHEVSAAFRFKSRGAIRAFHPHMHLRGKSFTLTLEYPNGDTREVLRIDPWRFNWQYVYELVTPIEVPRGARLIATAIYDNSAANPYNPDPTQDVTFGRLSTDEMMLGYFEWFRRE